MKENALKKILALAFIVCIGIATFSANTSSLKNYARYGSCDDEQSIYTAKEHGFLDGCAEAGGFSYPVLKRLYEEGFLSKESYLKALDVYTDPEYVSAYGNSDEEQQVALADIAEHKTEYAAWVESVTPKTTSSSSTATETKTTETKTTSQEKEKVTITSVDVVDATCTTEGSSTTNYSDGKSETETIPALGHDYEEEITKEPSCGVAGEKTFTCSRCGDTYTEEIPALEHDYQLTNSKEPSCTEKGFEEYTCTLCGDTYITEKPALGHDEGEWVTVSEPERFREGLKELRCTRCGEVLESETIPQLFPISLGALFGLVVGGAVLLAGVLITIVLRIKR